MSLRKLIEAVERGEDTENHHAAAFPSESAYGHCTWHDSHKASGGDLNAAKELHEALLPGWDWWSEKVDGRIFCSVKPENKKIWDDVSYADNPARAWLLAILHAIEAKGEQK